MTQGAPSPITLLPNGTDQSMQVHFAMQLCDRHSFQGHPRVCGDDRTALSQRSVMSLVDSVRVAAEIRPRAHFNLMLFADDISQDLQRFCWDVMSSVGQSNVQIDLRDISPMHGIGDSILTCYQYMQDHGRDVVGQFQDDYLFQPQAISDSIDMLLQIQAHSNTDALVTPHHFAAFWRELYANQSTPRCIIIGPRDYWIQIYDIACTFITTHAQFSRHWDLYNIFIELCKMYQDGREFYGLENQSLNHIMTRRAVLAVMPMRTLSHHVQSQRELDPHQDWRDLWNSINIQKIRS